MNVKYLWCYIDAKRALNMARDNLVEYEHSIYSPNAPGYTGMPIEHGNGDTDRLAPLAEKHGNLLSELISAMIEADRAYKLLDAFAKELTDEERELLYARYRKGLTLAETVTYLHRCERTLRRINNRIKEKFSKFEKNVR